jgi:cytochrome c oxidase subunit I
MHFSGLLGMPRRVYTYDANQGWDMYNRMSTVGAIIVAVASLIFGINILISRKRGTLAGNNPWGAGTLEWSIPSPPPVYNFVHIPLVSSRYPLWDMAGHDSGDAAHGGAPAAGATKTAAAAPDRATAGRVAEQARIPSADELGIPIPYTTTKPFFAALGIVTMFCGLILTRLPNHTPGLALLAVGVATLIGSLYWWVTTPLEPELAHHH